MLSQGLIIVVLSTGIYMLVALGFTLVFGVMRVVNFAHGEFLMLGAYGLYVFQMLLGFPYVYAVLLAATVCGLLGVVFERLLFRRFRGDELGGMILSLGLGISLQGAVRAVFGVDGLSVSRPFEGSFAVGGLSIPRDQTVVAAVAVLLVALVFWGLARTRAGLALRAVAQDPRIAELQGIVPWKMYALAFGGSCLLAGFAGALMAPVYEIQSYMGEQALMRAFIVVVLGGLGSIPGALVASFVLGVIDTSVALLVSSTAATLASFRVVIVLLIVRPAGLMGRA